MKSSSLWHLEFKGRNPSKKRVASTAPRATWRSVINSLGSVGSAVGTQLITQCYEIKGGALEGIKVWAILSRFFFLIRGT